MIDERKLEGLLHGQSLYRQVKALKTGAFGRTGQELAGIEFEELLRLAVDLVESREDWEHKLDELEEFLR